MTDDSKHISNITRLREQLADVNARLKKQIAYREDLLERIETLKSRNGSLVDYRDKLLGRIEKLKGYWHSEIDTLEHNTQASMDAFFENIPDKGPYIAFGRALSELAQTLSLDLDGKTVADFGVGPGLALNAFLETR